MIYHAITLLHRTFPQNRSLPSKSYAGQLKRPKRQFFYFFFFFTRFSNLSLFSCVVKFFVWATAISVKTSSRLRAVLFATLLHHDKLRKTPLFPYHHRAVKPTILCQHCDGCCRLALDTCIGKAKPTFRAISCMSIIFFHHDNGLCLIAAFAT